MTSIKHQYLFFVRILSIEFDWSLDSRWMNKLKMSYISYIGYIIFDYKNSKNQEIYESKCKYTNVYSIHDYVILMKPNESFIVKNKETRYNNRKHYISIDNKWTNCVDDLTLFHLFSISDLVLSFLQVVSVHLLLFISFALFHSLNECAGHWIWYSSSIITSAIKSIESVIKFR